MAKSRAQQGELVFFRPNEHGKRRGSEILRDLERINALWNSGALGGEQMPEDARPQLPKGSADLVHYLTLPMALNYQRDSYALWRAATQAFEDKSTRFVFSPIEVTDSSEDSLRAALVKHRVALQPNKHVATWQRICLTLSESYKGDARNFFKENEYDVSRILSVMENRGKEFPYLRGKKIGNYWLYVLHLYSGLRLRNLSELTIAPDTHVIQASRRLGVVADTDAKNEEQLKTLISKRWRELLADTDLAPIDIHTPLWLWSRAGFP